MPVTIDGLDVIYIKPKMGFGSLERVKGALTRSVIQAEEGGALAAEFDLGRANIALLVENIVGWEGPAFADASTGKSVPVNPVNIEQLDSDNPLVNLALAEINKRNAKTLVGPGNGDKNMGEDKDKDEGAGNDPNLTSATGGSSSSKAASKQAR